MAEWLAHLLAVWKVPGSNPGPSKRTGRVLIHESCRITVHGHKHCEPANCLGQLSLLPVTGMVNEYSFGWVRAASDSSVGNSRQDYVRGINVPTYLLIDTKKFKKFL